MVFISYICTVQLKQYTMSEVQKLQVEVDRLKAVLQAQIDYHHHIGNSDCPYSTNTILVHLYKSAENGLKGSE